MQGTNQEIKDILRELLREVAGLKERVMELERHLNLPSPPPPSPPPIALEAESYENIGRIYNEGYHICPVAFGRVRDEGDCLFCVNILERK